MNQQWGELTGIGGKKSVDSIALLAKLIVIFAKP